MWPHTLCTLHKHPLDTNTSITRARYPIQARHNIIRVERWVVCTLSMLSLQWPVWTVLYGMFPVYVLITVTSMNYSLWHVPCLCSHYSDLYMNCSLWHVPCLCSHYSDLYELFSMVCSLSMLSLQWPVWTVL